MGTGDGRFHIEPFRRDLLRARLEAAKAKLGAAPTPNDLMLIRSEILDIGREMFVQDDRMKKAERLAAKAGDLSCATVDDIWLMITSSTTASHLDRAERWRNLISSLLMKKTAL